MRWIYVDADVDVDVVVADGALLSDTCRCMIKFKTNAHRFRLDSLRVFMTIIDNFWDRFSSSF